MRVHTACRKGVENGREAVVLARRKSTDLAVARKTMASCNGRGVKTASSFDRVGTDLSRRAGVRRDGDE